MLRRGIFVLRNTATSKAAMNSTVTQKEIAHKLGVSPGMVGRALRNDPAYSAQTRERIQNIAREMGYHQGLNQGARQMASRRHGRRAQHGMIGLLPMAQGSDDLPYYAHLQQGVLRAAHLADFDVLTLNPTPSAGWERVDGLIVHGEVDDERFSQMALPMPYVGLMQNRRDRWGVSADGADGTRRAVQHLLELGHRNIGFLGSPEVATVNQRIHAYRKALTAGGFAVNPLHQWILWDHGPMEKSGRFSMESWLQSNFHELKLTALLVQNDRAAIGAMSVLQKAGYRVPDDISVIGFDSTDECELSTPRLTSVRVPLELIGAKAVELLLMQIREGEEELEPQNLMLPVDLEIRDSCAAAA